MPRLENYSRIPAKREDLVWNFRFYCDQSALTGALLASSTNSRSLGSISESAILLKC